jgi:hypothetical protein
VNIFTRSPDPTCEEQLEQLRRKIRELEFLLAKNPAKLNVDGNCLDICGMSYSLALFEQLGGVEGKPLPFLPVGAVFQLTGRYGGSIHIRQIKNEIEIRRAVKELEEREAKRRADLENITPMDPYHG